MKNIYFVSFFLIGAFANGQVGINTAVPESTLDVVAKNETGSSTNVDGLLIPRVDRQRAQAMTRVPISTLIYVNGISTGAQAGTAINIDAVGYYYYNGSVWVKLNSGSSSNVNIYNSDGTLTGNRIVTQGDKTLAFTGTVNNAFSIDGNTFSVDAANDKVGIGTTAPETKVHVVANTASANRYNLIDAPASSNQNVILALRNTSPIATGNYSLLGFTNSGSDSGGANWGIGSVRTATGEDFYFGNSLGTSYLERMRIVGSTGNVGIGTSTPSPSALVELSSTVKGFLPPRMSTVQRDAINPKPEGLIIYNLDIHCLQYWNATEWIGNCSNGSTTGGATITNCTTTPLNGTYQAGIAMNNGNTVTITVNVMQLGSWSASSNSINGISFNGSGNFTALGSQNITLTATGTPVSSGSFGYTFSLGSSTCTRNINFDAQALAICNIGPANLPNSFTISGQNVSISATHTGNTNNNQIFGCSDGGANSGSIDFPTSWALGWNGTETPTTTTFTFSRPVKDVEIYFNELNNGQAVTFAAQNGSGASFSPTLVTVGYCTAGSYIVSGNKVSAPASGSTRRNTGLKIRVSGNSYFTKLTLNHNGLSNALSGSVQPPRPYTAAQLVICNATAQ